MQKILFAAVIALLLGAGFVNMTDVAFAGPAEPMLPGGNGGATGRPGK